MTLYGSGGNGGNGAGVAAPVGTICNCIVASNKTGDGGDYQRLTTDYGIHAGNGGDGAGIFGGITVINCTVAGNLSGTRGVGLTPGRSGLGCGVCGAATLTNDILWDNYGSAGIANAAAVTYSCIQGGYPGTGNLDGNPLLTADWYLQKGSAAIDRGSPSLGYDGQTDIDGEPRLYNNRVDIGADEFIDTDNDGVPNWWESEYFGAHRRPGIRPAILIRMALPTFRNMLYLPTRSPSTLPSITLAQPKATTHMMVLLRHRAGPTAPRQRSRRPSTPPVTAVP